jgi:hypothetical protein
VVDTYQSPNDEGDLMATTSKTNYWILANHAITKHDHELTNNRYTSTINIYKYRQKTSFCSHLRINYLSPLDALSALAD